MRKSGLLLHISSLPAKYGIGTLGKDDRGPERLVYSNTGLIYYTADHYETFQLLYSEDGETCSKSYERSTMYITQAPQGYTMERILWAHDQAYKRGILDPVSSSELFIELGEKVHIFLGERFNIKVTTPEDLTTLRSQYYYENYKKFAKEELKYGL